MSVQITLHWWMFPMFVFISGMFMTWKTEDRGGYLSGMDNMIWFVLTVIIVVALVIGHYM